MSIRRCTPSIRHDEYNAPYIHWDDDPRGEYVFYSDHVNYADYQPIVKAIRSACILLVEDYFDRGESGQSKLLSDMREVDL